MFNYRFEDMKYKDMDNIELCEVVESLSRVEKLEYLDLYSNGALSYVLELADKYAEDYSTLPKDRYGNVRSVSKKAWVKRNNYRDRDAYFRMEDYEPEYYGYFILYGCKRPLWKVNDKSRYDTYDDLIDEVFYRYLKHCRTDEGYYFRKTDKYEVGKNLLKDNMTKYNTTFGIYICYDTKGKVFIQSRDDDGDRREITMEEIDLLLEKYSLLRGYIERLTAEVNIEV